MIALTGILLERCKEEDDQGQESGEGGCVDTVANRCRFVYHNIGDVPALRVPICKIRGTIVIQLSFIPPSHYYE